MGTMNTKRIFRVMWYNEDDYGVMGAATAVVQTETPEEAKEFAKGVFVSPESTDHFLAGFAKFSCEDITDKKVLSVSLDSW